MSAQHLPTFFSTISGPYRRRCPFSWESLYEQRKATAWDGYSGRCCVRQRQHMTSTRILASQRAASAGSEGRRFSDRLCATEEPWPMQNQNSRSIFVRRFEPRTSVARPWSARPGNYVARRRLGINVLADQRHNAADMSCAAVNHLRSHSPTFAFNYNLGLRTACCGQKCFIGFVKR